MPNCPMCGDALESRNCDEHGHIPSRGLVRLVGSIAVAFCVIVALFWPPALIGIPGAAYGAWYAGRRYAV